MKNVFKFAYVTLAVAAMAVCCSTDAFAAGSPCQAACTAGADACNANCAPYCTDAGEAAQPGFCGACTGGCDAGAAACNKACVTPTKPS